MLAPSSLGNAACHRNTTVCTLNCGPHVLILDDLKSPTFKGLDADTMSVLKQEQNQYQDLGFLPHFKDAYNSLTQKLAESYKWAATTFGGFKWPVIMHAGPTTRTGSQLQLMSHAVKTWAAHCSSVLSRDDTLLI